MAVKPIIILKLDWLIEVSPTLEVIFFYQADWKAFHGYHTEVKGSITPCGHMTYKDRQIRLDPTGRVRNG